MEEKKRIEWDKSDAKQPSIEFMVQTRNEFDI